MNYKEAVMYIDDMAKYGSNLGLETMGNLLEILGNPGKDLKYIHIAGTNGKGSTSSYIANSLEEAGYRVGLFTSPFLERFNERIQINGMDIPDDILAKNTVKIKDAIDIMLEKNMKHPTTFEIITALMFLYFQDEQPDYIVLEVGLGGRLDSTNIIEKSLISVMTTIAIDHIAQLGNTLDKIAYQKGGIIKENGLVISYPQEEEVIQVFKDICKDKNAEFYIDDMKDIQILEETEYGSRFNYVFGENRIDNVEIGMIGEYQVYNASLAINTLILLREKGLVDISDKEILRGIKKTRWNGRLEVIHREPTFLIDGAHNKQGVDQLRKALELFKYDRLILVIAVLKDKDVSHIVDTLMSIADEIIVTEVEDPRKTSAEELHNMAKSYNKNAYIELDKEKAVDRAYKLAGKEDLVVFAGSLYLVGEIRTIVNSKFNN